MNYEIVDSAETFDAALARVRAAQAKFGEFTQEQVDKIFLAAASGDVKIIFLRRWTQIYDRHKQYLLVYSILCAGRSGGARQTEAEGIRPPLPLKIVRVLYGDLVGVRRGAGIAALGVRLGGLPDGQVHGFLHGIAGIFFAAHGNASLRPDGFRAWV